MWNTVRHTTVSKSFYKHQTYMHFPATSRGNSTIFTHKLYIIRHVKHFPYFFSDNWKTITPVTLGQATHPECHLTQPWFQGPGEHCLPSTACAPFPGALLWISPCAPALSATAPRNTSLPWPQGSFLHKMFERKALVPRRLFREINQNRHVSLATKMKSWKFGNKLSSTKTCYSKIQ